MNMRFISLFYITKKKRRKKEKKRRENLFRVFLGDKFVLKWAISFFVHATQLYLFASYRYLLHIFFAIFSFLYFDGKTNNVLAMIGKNRFHFRRLGNGFFMEIKRRGQIVMELWCCSD